MKSFIKYFFNALPLTLGMILTLLALSFLVKFYDYGLDFEEPEFWIFGGLFILGFPLLIWGTNRLADKAPNN